MHVLIFLVQFCIWVGFWVRQFAELMAFEDDVLPSKYDKFIWAALFIFMAPLAPFAFVAFKQIFRAVPERNGYSES